jgi:GNAT superfamily N-acetyltransferase
MIRPAKSTDAFALADLLGKVHATTVYNGIAMDPAFARKLFAQFAHRHGGSHDGATCLFVQDREGVICGFVAGMLDRVYHVGDDLWASDVFIHAAKGEPSSTVNDLLAAYVDWAEANQRVYEVRLSASFATPEGRRIGKLYERMGFEECGRVYRRVNPAFAPLEKAKAA